MSRSLPTPAKPGCQGLLGEVLLALRPDVGRVSIFEWARFLARIRLPKPDFACIQPIIGGAADDARARISKGLSVPRYPESDSGGLGGLSPKPRHGFKNSQVLALSVTALVPGRLWSTTCTRATLG